MNTLLVNMPELHLLSPSLHRQSHLDWSGGPHAGNALPYFEKFSGSDAVRKQDAGDASAAARVLPDSDGIAAAMIEPGCEPRIKGGRHASEAPPAAAVAAATATEQPATPEDAAADSVAATLQVKAADAAIPYRVSLPCSLIP
jgi:hypothetical protein